MAEEKYEIVWKYRNIDTDLWEDEVIKTYNNSPEFWTKICKEPIEKYWKEKVVFYLFCADNYPSYVDSIMNGMKDEVEEFTSESQVVYKCVKKNSSGKIKIDGEKAANGYYLVEYYKKIRKTQIWRSILEMLNVGIQESEQEIGETDQEILKQIEGGGEEFQKSFVGWIEKNISEKEREMRKISISSGEESNIKLRCLLLITGENEETFEEIFDDIQNERIFLPKQIKVIGRINSVPPARSSNSKKIVSLLRSYKKEDVINKENKSKTTEECYIDLKVIDIYSKQRTQYDIERDSERNINDERWERK